MYYINIDLWMPKTPISWKFPDELLNDLKKLADVDSRPLNNLAEKILSDYVKANKGAIKKK